MQILQGCSADRDPFSLKAVVASLGVEYLQFLGEAPLLATLFGQPGKVQIPSTFVFAEEAP